MFFSVKLNGCATPSKTSASPIMAVLQGWDACDEVGVAVTDSDRIGQEAQLAAGGLRQAVGGPGLVPDDVDLARVHAGLVLHGVRDVHEHPAGERVPAGGEEQFHPGVAVLNV